MKLIQKKILQRIEDIEADARRASEETVRGFLRRKVGRWLIATLLGEPGKPNIAKADAYLYKKAKLDNLDMMRLEECYLAASIVYECRFFKECTEPDVTKVWLKMPCLYLEEHAPICALRDGRSYGHLTAVGAAKTFLLKQYG